MKRASWRPFSPARCRPASSSPVEAPRTFRRGRLQPLDDRRSHARDGFEEERLLDGSPVALRHQDRRVPLPGNLNGFVRVSDVLQEVVQSPSRLGCCDSCHRGISNKYVITYAIGIVLSIRFSSMCPRRTFVFQPRRLIFAPAADGCKRVLGSGLPVVLLYVREPQ